MRKILRLAKREYLASVKTKGFLITLVLMPVIMGVSGIAFYFLHDQVDTKDKKVVIIDKSGAVAPMLLHDVERRNSDEVFDKETGKKIKPAYLFEVIEDRAADLAELRLALSERVRRGEIHAFLEIGADVLNPQPENNDHRITYHTPNAAVDELRNWFNGQINYELRKMRLVKAGVDISQANEILVWLQIEPMSLVSLNEGTGEIQEARRSSRGEALLAPIILAMLMFMMVMMGAMPLLNSTMEEKTQRVAEVLLGCLKPFEFMAGKILGGLGVSLTGSAVYLLGGIFVLSKIGLGDVIPFHVIPWFVLFLILEIVMMGSIFSALGSICNDPKDAQNLAFPGMFPLMIPLFIMMPVTMAPTTGFATGMSLFPLFTPILMLMRISSPVGIPMWQPWAGLVGVILVTLSAVWIGGRIFRIGILMQGQPPKISKVIRWALRG